MAAKQRRRGQVIARGKDTYLIRVFLGRDAEGKRKFLNKTVKGTKRDAEAELIKLLREQDTQTLVEPTKMSVREYLEKWLKTKDNLGVRTRGNYRRQIDLNIVPHIGWMKLEKVTPITIQELYGKLKENKGDATAAMVHRILTQAFHQALVWSLLAKNPMTQVRPPKYKPAKQKYLTPKQVERFLEATKGDRWYAYWLLLFTSGLRPQEASALKWSDLEGDMLTVQRALVAHGASQTNWKVSSTKTEAGSRTIILPDETVQALKLHKAKQLAYIMEQGERFKRQDFVFATKYGNAFTPTDAWKAWKKALKKARLPSVPLYATRHSHATHLLKEGVHPKVVQERLGHSDINVTLNTYSHVMPGMHREAAKKLSFNVPQSA